MSVTSPSRFRVWAVCDRGATVGLVLAPDSGHFAELKQSDLLGFLAQVLARPWTDLLDYQASR